MMLRFMGIPKGAKNKKAALEFAHWLLVPNNQEKIWKEMESQHLLDDHLGPFGGFSSLIEVNAAMFARYYPDYTRNIIVPSLVPSIPRLPDFWSDFHKIFAALD